MPRRRWLFLEKIGDIDLVLCDVVLPDGMSGPAMAFAIQQDDPCLKVIYMTGYSDDEAFAHGVPEDVTLLRKPFRLNQLVTMVAAELENDVGDEKQATA